MTNLLPPNSSAQERALTTVMAVLANVTVPLRALWSPQDCPVELLPWLAWSLSVDEWDSAWSEQQKRDTIAAAISVQKIKGTIGSVRQALASLGLEARVQEWFNQQPAGEPYTYKLYIDAAQQPAVQAALAKAIYVAESNKSLRSHLTEILVSVTSESKATVATATLLGTNIKITGFDPGIIVINPLALAIG